MGEVCLECWGLCIGIFITISMVLWWIWKRNKNKLNFIDKEFMEVCGISAKDILEKKKNRNKWEKGRSDSEQAYHGYLEYLEKLRKKFEHKLSEVSQEQKDATESFYTAQHTYTYKRFFLGLTRVKKEMWSAKLEQGLKGFSCWIWVDYV